MDAHVLGDMLFFTRQQLEDSPSRADGVSADEERALRRAAQQIIIDVCLALHMCGAPKRARGRARAWAHGQGRAVSLRNAAGQCGCCGCGAPRPRTRTAARPPPPPAAPDSHVQYAYVAVYLCFRYYAVKSWRRSDRWVRRRQRAPAPACAAALPRATPRAAGAAPATPPAPAPPPPAPPAPPPRAADHARRAVAGAEDARVAQARGAHHRRVREAAVARVRARAPQRAAALARQGARAAARPRRRRTARGRAPALGAPAPGRAAHARAAATLPRARAQAYIEALKEPFCLAERAILFVVGFQFGVGDPYPHVAKQLRALGLTDGADRAAKMEVQQMAWNFLRDRRARARGGGGRRRRRRRRGGAARALAAGPPPRAAGAWRARARGGDDRG